MHTKHVKHGCAIPLGMFAAEREDDDEEAPRAKAGTAFGRASGLKKVKVGVITDKAKFVAAITEQPDFIEFLNAKVARLAKANVLLDGMTIKEELQ